MSDELKEKIKRYKDEEEVSSFDQVKKPADLLDDFWAILRSIIPIWIVDMVGPLLVGSLFVIIGIGEAVQALQQLYKIINNPQNNLNENERRIEIGVRCLVAVLGTVVLGLSLTLIAGGAAAVRGAGAVIPAMDSFNFIIVGLVLGIFLTRLVEKAHKFHFARTNFPDPAAFNDKKVSEFVEHRKMKLGFQVAEVMSYSMVFLGIGGTTEVLHVFDHPSTVLSIDLKSIGVLDIHITPAFCIVVVGVILGIMFKKLESRWEKSLAHNEPTGPIVDRNHNNSYSHVNGYVNGHVKRDSLNQLSANPNPSQGQTEVKSRGGEPQPTSNSRSEAGSEAEAQVSQHSDVPLLPEGSFPNSSSFFKDPSFVVREGDDNVDLPRNDTDPNLNGVVTLDELEPLSTLSARSSQGSSRER